MKSREAQEQAIVWKDIKGYEELYKISNYGKVFSKIKNRILSPYKVNGYLQIDLYRNAKRKHCRIHRLVAEAFIPNPNNHPIINHKDEDKINNHTSNLEWCTNEYNSNYGTRNSRIGEKNKGKKISIEQKKRISKLNKGKRKGGENPNSKKVICITTGERFDCMLDAKRKYKISSGSNIISCCRGRRNYCGKLKDGTPLIWRYIKEGE